MEHHATGLGVKCTPFEVTHGSGIYDHDERPSADCWLLLEYRLTSQSELFGAASSTNDDVSCSRERDARQSVEDLERLHVGARAGDKGYVLYLVSMDLSRGGIIGGWKKFGHQHHTLG